jgi:hypothetical protein
MRKDAKKVPAAPKRRACESCIFFDPSTYNDNEVLVHVSQRRTEFACRLLPKIEWVKAGHWCGQYRPD